MQGQSRVSPTSSLWSLTIHLFSLASPGAQEGHEAPYLFLSGHWVQQASTERL